MDCDRLEVLHNQDPERIDSTASTALRSAKLTASAPSRPRLSWSMGRRVPSKLMAVTSTGARLLMCSYPMVPTLITHLPKTAGAVGIGSMRGEIRCWKGWKWTCEMGGKGYGLICSPCRRGSGENAGTTRAEAVTGRPV